MVDPLITKQNRVSGGRSWRWFWHSPHHQARREAQMRQARSPDAATPELIVGVYGVISEEAERTTEHCGS